MIKPLRVHSKDSPIQDFEELYNKYFDMVTRVCFSYMKNIHDAEDVTANVFTKIVADGIQFETAEHEKAWILRVAINMCKDSLKNWWAKRANIDDYENLESPFKIDETLLKVLELPAKYKDVIYLYYYEGYSTKEVAEILNKPQSTILSQMRIARGLLKGVLSDEE